MHPVHTQLCKDRHKPVPSKVKREIISDVNATTGRLTLCKSKKLAKIKFTRVWVLVVIDLHMLCIQTVGRVCQVVSHNLARKLSQDIVCVVHAIQL